MRLTPLLDRFLPVAAPTDPVRARTSRVFVAVCLVGLVFEPLMSLRHFLVTHNRLAGWLTLFVAVLAAGLLVAIRRGVAIHIVMDVIGAIVVGMGGLVSLVRGGFYPSTLAGIGLVPLAAGLVRGRRGTFVWAVIAAAALVVVALPTSLGVCGLRRETAIDAGPLFVFLVASTAIALIHERAKESSESERDDLRRRIALAHRLESLGHLAAGVAHDFNNLLTVFRAAGESMVDELPPGHPLRADAEAVRDAADRGATIARELLAFSRPQISTAEAFDVVEAVVGMESLLRRALPETIALRVEASSRKLWVAGDPRPLLNVVLNLVVNARDALPRGGNVTIAVRLERVPHHSDEHPLPPGPYAAIEVKDDGTGIPPDVLPQIFTPYFTTKSRERGSGIGLASAYGVVRGFRGELRVAATAPGRGTTFEILLPIAKPPARPAKAALAASRPKVAPPRVVLVVDDQPELAAAARRLLSSTFEILTASGGEDALALFASRPDVDVVLTDACMPTMTGVELAARLRMAKPTIAIVYMTGYSDDPAIAIEVAEGRARLVRKPFDRATVVAAVKQALNPE